MSRFLRVFLIQLGDKKYYILYNYVVTLAGDYFMKRNNRFLNTKILCPFFLTPVTGLSFKPAQR